MPLRGCIPSLVRRMRSTEVQRQAPSFAIMLSALACIVPIAHQHAPELSRRMDSYHFIAFAPCAESEDVRNARNEASSQPSPDPAKCGR